MTKVAFTRGETVTPTDPRQNPVRSLERRPQVVGHAPGKHVTLLRHPVERRTRRLFPLKTVRGELTLCATIPNVGDCSIPGNYCSASDFRTMRFSGNHFECASAAAACRTRSAFLSPAIV